MNWETLYRPNRSCHHYGRPFGQGLLVKNGTSHGKKQALCRSCGRRVSLTDGTAYFDLAADPALFELTVRALAEGNSIQGTARIAQIDKDHGVCVVEPGRPPVSLGDVVPLAGPAGDRMSTG